MPAFFITGTNTGVGKTFFSYLLARELKELGFNVGYWKPIETGVGDFPEDAKLLTDLLVLPLEDTITYTFKLPLAPYVAEKHEGERIDLNYLKQVYEDKINRYQVLIIEGAGGLAVPIKRNYTYGDFAKDLNLPVLIVGRATLGTINDCFLTAFYGKALKLNILGFVLNGFTGKDLSEKDNPEVVEEMTALPVLFKVPKGDLNGIRLEKKRVEQLLELLGF